MTQREGSGEGAGRRPFEVPIGGGFSLEDATPSFVMGAVAVLVGVDAIGDLDSGGSWIHIALELVIMVVAAVGAVRLWRQLVTERRHNRALRVDLTAAREDNDRLRQDVEAFRAETQEQARGLGEAIDRQFERWALSPAEREVALLLLKGLSHKEAADVRDTSERTVRQQALAVYRKAGLAGRAELAAFFLEDLLLPRDPAALAHGPEGG
jgi:DNA-binding CsgD family transcriptional regulator